MFLATEDLLSWAVPIAIGLFIGYLIATRGKGKSDQVMTMEAEEFRANTRKGQLVDIRKSDKFETEKINGSRNFPGRDVFAGLFKLRNDQAIFLYSDSDKGAIKSVAKKLVKKGYMPVYILKGGFKEWSFI